MQWDLSALVAVVIVLVPIALGAPAVLMLVPPAMTLAPATLPSRVQFAAFVVGLGAVAAMFPDGFVKLMIGVSWGRCVRARWWWTGARALICASRGRCARR